MAYSVNKLTLVGRLGGDPVVKETKNGAKIVSLSVATTDAWKDRDTGEQRSRTEWHRVVIYKPFFADLAERFLKKGQKVYIEGVLRKSKWVGPDGMERLAVDVVIENFRGELVLLDSSASKTDTSTDTDENADVDVDEYFYGPGDEEDEG